MSKTIISLQKKIKVTKDLQNVVRAMKTMSASNVSQYDQSLKSISDYYENIEQGLALGLQKISWNHRAIPSFISHKPDNSQSVGIVVFGSDQGLVGKFNESIARYAEKIIDKTTGNRRVWAIGEKLLPYFLDQRTVLEGTFLLPLSVKTINNLVNQILFEVNCETLYIIYHHKVSGMSFQPKSLKLLPLDKTWLANFNQYKWPSQNLPEVIGSNDLTLKNLIREHLFVLLFKACIQSLLSENISRLLVMQRADKNIEKSLISNKAIFHQLRQTSIDNELFDIILGFEALQPNN